MKNVDEKFMQRAIDIASNGLGMAAPNPLVGAVIVAQGRIIGEGYHRVYKSGHAETNAFDSVRKEDQHLIKGATMYVTLEPCAHYGHTPPCSMRVVKEGIARLVMAQADPFFKVAGNGVKIMEEAGVQVETGLLENEARFLTRRFLKSVIKKQPYLILKWAQSADGFVGKEGEQVWLTGPEAKRLSHKWRTEEAAILVGRKTATVDNPRLTAREWSGKQPLRIVIDKEGKLSPSLHLFDGSQTTLVVSAKKDPNKKVEHFCPTHWENIWEQVLDELGRRSITSLIVEGGPHTLQQLIDLGIWDEARVLISPSTLGTGIKAPDLPFKAKEQQVIGQDLLNLYYSK